MGLKHYAAGRAGDFSVEGLSGHLATLGFQLGRLKNRHLSRDSTAGTIDYSRLEPQYGDEPPPPLSFSSQAIRQSQLPCHLTYTNRQTHAAIRAGLDRSPMYSGAIQGRGPRYCPSIEDKIVRFQDKPRHQIFLEPEGTGYRRGVSQRAVYQPAARRAAANGPLHSRPGRGGNHAARLCD